MGKAGAMWNVAEVASHSYVHQDFDVETACTKPRTGGMLGGSLLPVPCQGGQTCPQVPS